MTVNRVLHEYAFEVMSITALPKSDIKTITPYWNRVLLVLKDLKPDQAVFFKCHQEDPQSTDISRLRANFVTQIKRYMPDFNLVVTRDVLRGGIFVHLPPPDAGGDPDTTTEPEGAEDPDPEPAPNPHYSANGEAHQSEPLRDPHLIATAEAAAGHAMDALRRSTQIVQETTLQGEPPCFDDEEALAEDERVNGLPPTQEGPRLIDDALAAAVEAAKVVASDDDSFTIAVDLSQTPAPSPAPRRRGSGKTDKDGELIIDPRACSCAPYWKATGGFRKYAPDRHGPYHQGKCPLWSSWMDSPDYPPCSCGSTTPLDQMGAFMKAHASDPQAWEGDSWSQPGDHHAKDCPRHVHRFKLPSSGTGSMSSADGVIPSICACGETKDHRPFSDANNTVLVRAGNGGPKKPGEADAAES